MVEVELGKMKKERSKPPEICMQTAAHISGLMAKGVFDDRYLVLVWKAM